MWVLLYYISSSLDIAPKIVLRIYIYKKKTIVPSLKINWNLIRSKYKEAVCLFLVA